MKKFILLLLISSVLNSFGQETKKIKVKHKNPYYNEVYYVLKDDKSVKHGEYKKTTGIGKVLLEGKYENGQKNGPWTFSDYQGNILKTGSYEDDKPIGIWKVFNGRDKPKYLYDFSSNKITKYNYQHTKDSIARIIIAGDTIKANVDHPALPKIETSIVDEVYNQVYYPADAKDRGINGTVIVSVIINEDGSSLTPTVYQSVFPSLDNEAVRVISNMEGKWIPANYHGKPVKTLHLIPLRFQLR